MLYKSNLESDVFWLTNPDVNLKRMHQFDIGKLPYYFLSEKKITWQKGISEPVFYGDFV